MSLKIVSRPLPNAGRGYSPAGEGPFPAVLLLHRSAGKWSDGLTRRLRSWPRTAFWPFRSAIPMAAIIGTRATSSMCRSTGQPRRWLLRAHELSANEIGF